MCTRVRILKNEVEFWNKIATWCNKNIPEKKIVELQVLFKDDGGLRNFVEEKLRCLISDIKSQKVSLEGFTVKHAELLGDLLNCSSINQDVLEELSGLIYGADERARYFDKWIVRSSHESVWITGLFFYKLLLTLYTEKID